MTPELLPHIDEHDNLIAIHPKETIKQQNLRHRVSLIIPKTTDNKFILALRAKDKFPHPNVWVCAVGGKVQSHETYEQAALREMQEEANIQSTLKLIIPNSPYENDKEKYIAQVFTTIQEIPLHLLHPDPSEIQYFQSFSLEEAKTLINQHPEKFAPSFRIHFQRFIEKYTQ